jgi:hypothetical protein
MPEVKYRDGRSETQRINHRLKPSNEMQTASSFTTNGSGPTRVHTSVHHGSSQMRHDNPRSRSVLDADAGDNLRPPSGRVPTAGPPIMGRKGTRQ